MRMHSMNLRPVILIALTAMLTACGSGSGSSLPYQPPSGGDVTTSTVSSVALSSLTTAGFTVTGTLPPASVVASIHEALSTSTPSGVTPLSQERQAASKTMGAVVGTATNLLYITFSSTTN